VDGVKNNSLALWDFVYSLKPGDILYAKQGTGRILGWGVVTSDLTGNNPTFHSNEHENINH
jgi:hypothetical protein